MKPHLTETEKIMIKNGDYVLIEAREATGWDSLIDFGLFIICTWAWPVSSR